MEAAGPCTPSSRQRLRSSSRLTACIRVNGGHFEHKFWASDFLLCFVCFVDTGCPKCDRYKHVQSANIVWNVTFMSETFTWYGSNITNAWQEIFTPVTLAFSCEVAHEKLWKSVNICKSYSKEICGTFFAGHNSSFIRAWLSVCTIAKAFFW